MAINEKNMTSGSPGKLIITFAIPLMLGNVFQQFYTMADTMIVGQVVGVEALAAVGAADWLVWLVFGIMTGMAQGFSILISQYYGAGEKENLKRAVSKKLCTDSDTFNNCTGIERSDRSTGTAVFTYSGECYRTEFDVYTNGICRNSNHCSV